MTYKDKLNNEQKKAVQFKEGPLLIVAGAGTGKTTVITERINYLITEKKVNPEEILALTFTEKAAQEMEERVDKALPMGYFDLWISTFHSFAQRILESHGLEIGLTTDFKLVDQTESWLLIRNNLDKFNLDYYQPRGNPSKFIHALIKHFSRCKDELITPEDYLKYAEQFRLDNDLRKDEEAALEVRRLEEVANAYHTYQQLLIDNDLLDFGDLINYCLELFTKRLNILKKYQQQFKYILIDEFQDTNYAQYQLIKLLGNEHNNITVVGDDDQCLPSDSEVLTEKGKKKIKNIRIGDEVLTAVGKGHIGISKVNHVLKNKKKTKLISVKTKKGYQVQITDNHKMFCHVSSANDKNKYFYVYLMWKQSLGWRIGITKNLAWRLPLERSADKILGIKACLSEKEARYHEQLYSLKYSIPTYCFKDRDGLMLKENKLSSLYKELDVEKGVKRLAKDLNIDLNNAHIYLAGVTRGKSKRIKINLNMCYRCHRSKEHVKKNKKLLVNGLIQHEVNLQTSNKEVIKKLEDNGFKLAKAKIGKRLHIVSKDLLYLGGVVKKLENLTNGIVEVKAKIGKKNYQHLPAVIIPAKNLLLGHFLPVKVKNQIIYDEIIDISEQDKILTVYDLEIDKTHNFIANGIVVHNSIYKFRGASVSNILEFKKDYPKSQEIFLSINYRSKQNILDLAYNFIQLNNPNRLEVKLKVANKKLSKKLKSALVGEGIIEHIHAPSLEEEMAGVINKIQEITNKEKGISYNDFAILVRANNQANLFVQGLERANIPYQYVASKGLFAKPIVLNLIAFLKLLDDYHESDAMYRVLTMPMWNLTTLEIVQLTYLARKKAWSLWEAVNQSKYELRLPDGTQAQINRVVDMIKNYSSLTKEEKVSKIVFDFLNDSGYLKFVDSEDELDKRQDFSYLGQFYKKIKVFEEFNDDKSVKNFLKQLGLELESGEQGSMQPLGEDEGPEMVKVMTVHAAKGLEFKYVFLVNMVDRRFPSMERSEEIELPDELIKEIIPEGDIHLQEERRLFYVAMTRAKLGLFLTSGEDYGGIRKKKLSLFMIDLGFKQVELKKNDLKVSQLEKVKPIKVKKTSYHDLLPKRFSFTQINDFQNCPRMYYYRYILKVPTQGNQYFSFGSTIHLSLQRFFEEAKKRQGLSQGDLFSKSKEGQLRKKARDLVSLEELLRIYEESWLDDWYQNKKQKEEYFKNGKEILKKFHSSQHYSKIIPGYLEKGFTIKIGEYSLGGKIDRIDDLGDRYRIIDYKTGKPKIKLDVNDKEQLLIYQMALESWQNMIIEELVYYYLEDDSLMSFKGTDNEKKKLTDKIIKTIEEIKGFDFEKYIKNHEKCIYCKEIL